jgi:hypothetical protein
MKTTLGIFLFLFFKNAAAVYKASSFELWLGSSPHNNDLESYQSGPT